MTHKTKEICEILKKYNLKPSLIDVFKIKPFDKKAILTPDDKNIFKIIGMSILLLITSINTYIVDQFMSIYIL